MSGSKKSGKTKQKIFDIQAESQPERALLVGLKAPSDKRHIAEELLLELAELTRSAGAIVVDSILQQRKSPDPGTFVGKGIVNDIKARLAEENITLVIFDDPLSPAQQRNLENIFEVKVLDRSRLILDIFASRARTAEAMAQVELAQLQYLLPRLTRAWTHLSRQHSAIGARGPGETQLEIDRRRIHTKITTLKKRLEKIVVQRDLRRKGRDKMLKVAFVGYTNAGKSTLFNRMTKATVAVQNRLFMTLDPTSRVMSEPYPTRVLFTDTVGFIRKLPHELIESFKSTLEEAVLADLLIHVVDCSDEFFPHKIEQTQKTLAEIGATAPSIITYNKIDLNPDFIPPPENSGDGEHLLVSAHTGAGVQELRNIIVRRIPV